MIDRYFIVINPVAERGQSILRLPMLTALFDAAGIEYEIHITTGKMDGYEKTLQFCKLNPDCKGIIGIGGDGIIQEIVAGMVDAFAEAQGKIPIPLGILPSSTGNDFVSTLEGGKAYAQAKYKADPETVGRNFVETVIKGRTRTIDVITAGGMGFLNIGHVGLDAEIARSAQALKYKYDEYAYWIAGFKSIATHENTHLGIEANGEKMQGEYTLVAVCNGKYYGGGLCIAPLAEIDNGKIALCVIEGMGRQKLALSFPKLLRGTHLRLKIVTFTECDRVKLTLPSTMLCLDGNFYPQEGEIEFKILPGALEVFV